MADIVSGITNVLGGNIADGIAKIIALFKVDPTVALEKSTELTKIQLDMQNQAANAVVAEIEGQIEINKIEAASNSKFVAGWRPAIGWVCAGSLFFDTIVRPVVNWISALSHHPLNAPALDMATLIPLMGGLLGFGAMRSYDKSQGTDNGH